MFPIIITPERLRKIKKWFVVCVVSTAIVAAGYFAFMSWYSAVHLFVTNTRPNSAVAASATDIVFWYNKPISSDTAKSFSISPKVAGKTIVNGNSLAFTPDTALNENQTYTATVSHSTSADGKYSMNAASVTFKVSYVPFDQQPKSVQDRSLKLTDPGPPSIAFIGADELLNQGVASGQLASMEAFLKKVFNSQKITDYVINIDNIQAAPYDSSSANPVATYNFDLQMNDHVYKATLDCAPLGDVRLRLYDTQGKQVEDSGTLSAEGGGQ